jgi:hypothetical protein
VSRVCHVEGLSVKGLSVQGLSVQGLSVYRATSFCLTRADLEPHQNDLDLCFRSGSGPFGRTRLCNVLYDYESEVFFSMVVCAVGRVTSVADPHHLIGAPDLDRRQNDAAPVTPPSSIP